MNTPQALTQAPAAPRARWWRRIEALFDSPQAYEWARAHWWTRWIVRRRPTPLFGYMAGFVHSQVLLACVQLRLFHNLSDAPATLTQLAQQLGLPPERLGPLLQSACVMELLALEDDHTYSVGALGRVVLSHSGIADMVEHNHLLYRDLLEPRQFLQAPDQGAMAAYWPYAQSDGAAPALRQEASGQLRHYSALMDASQGFVITEILDSYPFGDHTRVLDLGCGKGRFMRAVAQRFPQLQLQLMDLPVVLDLARQGFAQAGLAARAEFHPGSFLDDALPEGADLVTLVRVAHDHGDAALHTLLKKIAAILPPGGRLLLAEPMQLDGPEASVVDPYFHFYLQAMGEGRLRSPAELMQAIRAAGFVGVEQVPNALAVHAQIILAHKPRVNPVKEN